MAFQFPLNRFAGQKIKRLYVAVSGTRTDDGPAAVHFYLDGVATPVAGVRRRIANDVILVLLFGNAFHAREQVISVVNEKTSGAISKLIKNLLVHRGILRKRRNQLARLKVRVVQICV